MKIGPWAAGPEIGRACKKVGWPGAFTLLCSWKVAPREPAQAIQWAETGLRRPCSRESGGPLRFGSRFPVRAANRLGREGAVRPTGCRGLERSGFRPVWCCSARSGQPPLPLFVTDKLAAIIFFGCRSTSVTSAVQRRCEPPSVPKRLCRGGEPAFSEALRGSR